MILNCPGLLESEEGTLESREPEKGISNVHVLFGKKKKNRWFIPKPLKYGTDSPDLNWSSRDRFCCLCPKKSIVSLKHKKNIIDFSISYNIHNAQDTMKITISVFQRKSQWGWLWDDPYVELALKNSKLLQPCWMT